MCSNRAAQVLTETFEPDLFYYRQKEKATILHGFEAHWLDLSAQEKPKKLNIRLGTSPPVWKAHPIAERVQDVFCPTVSVLA